ncbi:protein of unknown function (plasmid) [Caballeronia sp. S22]
MHIAHFLFGFYDGYMSGIIYNQNEIRILVMGIGVFALQLNCYHKCCL